MIEENGERQKQRRQLLSDIKLITAEDGTCTLNAGFFIPVDVLGHAPDSYDRGVSNGTGILIDHLLDDIL